MKPPTRMSRLEAEAREVLLRRRRAITQSTTGGLASARLAGRETAVPARGDGAGLELAEIDAALERIEEGRFGVCVACGRALGLQRLRALPEARYCLACAGQPRVG